MDHKQIQQFANKKWDNSIIPALVDYIRIPAKSPLFDSNWKQHGYIDQAAQLMMEWCEQNRIEGAIYEVVELPGRTPTIFIDIPGSLDRTLLLYGHLDKQPEMVGWRDDLGPWQPVIEDDKLYGRGGADDGYAIFASITAVLALKEQGLPHANIKVLIEASEESGSPDLPAYMDALEDKIGSPDIVVCLDSGCGNYDQLWLTTSLRGMMSANLSVNVLSEGVHSGDAGGVVPSSFRIARQLLDRIEDQQTGKIKLPEFFVDIPAQRSEQVKVAAEVIGEEGFRRFPFVGATEEMGESTSERILNRTWRPSLEVTGANGIPAIESAGNVLRPETRLKLSMRLPPTADAEAAVKALSNVLLDSPLHNAQIELTDINAAAGWNAPETEAWLDQAVDSASRVYFGKPAVNMGEGGSIPFMGMLGSKYPKAQFVITGVLGPKSNAHGPNEFLHIPMGKKLTACVANIIYDHYLKHTSS